MSLLSLLSELNHKHDCQFWEHDAPGADDACTCGLTRYARLARCMPRACEDLLEVTFDLADAEARWVGTVDVRARYQRCARAAEVIALAVEQRKPDR